jgi:protein kinase-like protein
MKHELRPGDPELIGPYRLRGRLGAGGMGRVYLGLSPGGRAVAVKVIRAELAQDPEFRARFRREVAVARTVSGLYTAPVLDADTDGPEPWLATAYVPGPSLADAVTRHGPLPAASVLMLAAGLAEALSAIHGAGIVHRDLKPANVLLAADGPRLIDFGISRAAEASALTHTGLVVGSPGFMSPEQAEGREVGPASDVFSLGAVLAFAATGQGPFGSGSTPALVYRVVHNPPDLDQVPDGIRLVVERCLAKDPAARPTAANLLAGAAYPVQDWLPEPVTRTFRVGEVPLTVTTADLAAAGGVAAAGRVAGAADLAAADLAAAAGLAAAADLAAAAGLAAAADRAAAAAVSMTRAGQDAAGYGAPGRGEPGYGEPGYGGPGTGGAGISGGTGIGGEPGRRPRQVRWRSFAVAAVLAVVVGGGGGAAFALSGGPAQAMPSAQPVAGAATAPTATAPAARASSTAAASPSPARTVHRTRPPAPAPSYDTPTYDAPTHAPSRTPSPSRSAPPSSAPPSSTAPSPVTSPSPTTSSSGSAPPTSFPDTSAAVSIHVVAEGRGR